jgi:hypothetical protein
VEKVSSDRCTGGVMRIALAMLCIGAVIFLLRVLAALVKEAESMPGSTVVHFAKFKPSRRGQLVKMNIEVQKRNAPTRSSERMDL